MASDLLLYTVWVRGDVMLRKKWFTLTSLFIWLGTVACGQSFQSSGEDSATNSSLFASKFTIEINTSTESVLEGSDVLVVATIVGDDRNILSYNWQIQNESGAWENIGVQTVSLQLSQVTIDDSGIYRLLVTSKSGKTQTRTVVSSQFELMVRAVSVTPTPAPLSCGSLAHGASESRLMYQAASVVAPAVCNSETQVRTCNNGVLGEWSPNNFRNASCTIQPAVTPIPLNCGNLAHSAIETRVRYRDLQVVAPATCIQETQTRTCNNGTLSAWSPMNYFNTSCMVNQPTTPPPLASALYVSPNGSDTNAGTMTSPFRTFARAYSSATAGTTIYLRGGVYTLTTQLLLNRSGSSGNPIRVFNYPGEVPVLDGINMTTTWTQGAPLRITGNWNHVKGLEIRNGPEFGAVMEGTASNNTFEQLNVHHSGRLSQWEGKGITIFGSGSNNMILNCDSHHNRDLRNDNADGFMVSTTGSGTILRGNRAWRNSDDGFDLFNIADNTVGGIYTLEDNWAFENGYDDNLNLLGDGNGFKLGGRRAGTTSVNGGHTVRNCMAWGNRSNGFDDNGWNGGTRNFILYNNTSYNNGYSNYAFTNTQSLFKNNISVGSSRGAETRSGSNITYNSWTLPVTANASDFASTNSSIAVGPRNTDGSLPRSNFLRLTTGSDLINVGTDVGLPFSGIAPDLGAYEF